MGNGWAGPTPRLVQGPGRPAPKTGKELDQELLPGRQVRILFLNGKALSGRVGRVSRYTLLLETGGERCIVFKHSVVLAQLVERDGQA